MTRRKLLKDSYSSVRSKRKKYILERCGLRKYCDGKINLAVMFLIVFGTVMITSTNVGQATSQSNVVLNTLIKQGVVIGISYACMWGVNRAFSFRWFLPLRPVFFLIMMALMGACFLYPAEKGAQAWIRIAGVTIQPGEFAKPFMFVLIASCVVAARRNTKKCQNFWTFYRYPIVAMACFTVFLIFQRDLGTLFIILMIFLMGILIYDHPALAKGKRLIKMCTYGILFLCLASFFIPETGLKMIESTGFGHIATRIENAKNPYGDIYAGGYQPANSLYGIASSNIVGKGIGNSSRKYGYLTQADNDYILAVTIEETGILGLGFITFCYGLIIYRLFKYAFKTNECAYKIVLSGTAMYLFMHFFLNVGGVACLIPFTGVPLLFISSGGSSLMAICISIGLSQQCISQIRVKEQKVCES